MNFSVASCITEITRITTPDAPYDTEQMKEIFQLIVATFENLSICLMCPIVTIPRRFQFDIVAKDRSCLVMLDLECDALIVVSNFL